MPELASTFWVPGVLPNGRKVRQQLQWYQVLDSLSQLIQFSVCNRAALTLPSWSDKLNPHFSKKKLTNHLRRYFPHPAPHPSSQREISR
jgi:hypothetical protein